MAKGTSLAVAEDGMARQASGPDLEADPIRHRIEVEMERRCGRDFDHLAHKWMLGRELYRCDGSPFFEPDPELDKVTEELHPELEGEADICICGEDWPCPGTTYSGGT